VTKPTKGQAPAQSTQALDQIPVTGLKRVGPKLAERLRKLRIQNVADLLFHLPSRYQDRSRLRALYELRDGDEALVEGVVETSEIAMGRRRSLKVWLREDRDGLGGGLMLRFFHFSRAQIEAMGQGKRLRCFGEVRQGPQSLEMIHPEVQYRTDDLPTGTAVDAPLTPIYPSTEGMQQITWRGLTDQALALLTAHPGSLADLVPAEITGPLRLPTLDEALRIVHRPPVGTPVQPLVERSHPACLRLAFDEMLAHQLALRRLRQERRHLSATPLGGNGALRGRLLDGLPFELTAAQRRVLDEIAADLGRPQPMMRLLQGDVGSGKTVVGALAALQAMECGRQVALMAPTELLAEQHRKSLAGWLAPLGIEVAWLSGRHKGAERTEKLARLADGSARVVVGTHALFQQDVRFAEPPGGLGLVIIDEQHRFGVHQRMALREKGAGDGRLPHQLIMTATPIPRSLAMAVYADLDLSVIDELPPGRTPITTVAVPDGRRDEVIERVRNACASGRQAYWVCTLVEESEALQAQAAEDAAADLRERLGGLRIGLVHGRVKAAEREPVMAAFAAGELDLLVATTVIEVGVDVPNASLMIIENPERLGLAQLHQLRGRVGRGTVESYCLLLFHAPLSANARERLDILRRETSGFAIADADLRIRGAGEVLGTRQAGMASFRLADPLRDKDLVRAAQQGADRLLEDGSAAGSERVRGLIHRWLGDREVYGRV
jgi:ATP-dependent DNA helicase RecG